ncbi:hypothetical protein BAUCODRAFT_282291 [Baudoinia panamericana UAMH 10762]|uniref:Uncharacterized protein n=1 Tax=Baudoinia panamericana (strain UAMH 10762) TaxID=717646 RepID=M2MZX1_BAUPA|nr:uncharacterized protein BAUCODRAFT_282291 [Baudoinia panamericana UAMH 10762]EMC92224.1 hypothetical protein BAUCODRAFT_282291 [Baudoinia panamericana UAMH 10762]
MASLYTFLNRLLPFATPGTPILQDVLHLAIICSALYFAPQIQSRFQEWHRGRQDEDANTQGQLGHTETQLDPRVQDDGEDLLTDGREDEAAEPAFNADGHADDTQAEAVEPTDMLDDHPRHAPQVQMPSQRNVGAKKAKALAKRDQRRAYNEFMRSQGDIQRARDAEGAQEREAVLAAERQRRRATEAALEARKARERGLKREQETKAREAEIKRRELAVSTVKRQLDEKRMVNLFDVAKLVGDDADDEWVERILNAAGVLGRSGSMMTMVTATRWVVRVTEKDMHAVYERVLEQDMSDADGKISFDTVATALQNALVGS